MTPVFSTRDPLQSFNCKSLTGLHSVDPDIKEQGGTITDGAANRKDISGTSLQCSQERVLNEITYSVTDFIKLLGKRNLLLHFCLGRQLHRHSIIHLAC